MGGKWSKSSIVGWPAIRERIRRTNPAERRTEPAAEGVGAVSQDLGKHGQSQVAIQHRQILTVPG
uniref:Truncated nef protein n=1 Tax=Human immunodeficiency virus type 1 TaxID=11676 RepID=Q8ADK6_HV1|nr:truncated nef protein [Human immunodeficiency virus 1]